MRGGAWPMVFAFALAGCNQVLGIEHASLAIDSRSGIEGCKAERCAHTPDAGDDVSCVEDRCDAGPAENPSEPDAQGATNATSQSGGSRAGGTGGSAPHDSGAMAHGGGGAAAIDSGASQSIDSGMEPSIDGGTKPAIDSGMSGLVPQADSGTAQPHDSGAAQPHDSGTTQPHDSGTTQPHDSGAAQPHDSGTTQPHDSGVPATDAGSCSTLGLDVDPLHCGDCATVCPYGVCRAGVCAVELSGFPRPGTTTINLGANTQMCVGIRISKAGMLVALGGQTVTTGVGLRLGLYRDDGTGAPQGLVAQTGALTTRANDATEGAVPPTAVSVADYWLCVVSDATLRLAAETGKTTWWYASFNYGTLPNTPGALQSAQVARGDLYSVTVPAP